MVLGASATNVAVDPYGMFGAPRVAWFNEAKPFAGDRGRTVKIHQVLRIRPRGLIVGNSRPEMGLDPDHPCWPHASRPVYNIALPGLGVRNQVRYAQHAVATGSVKTVVFGLDFSDFLTSAANSEQIGERDSLPLLVDADGRRRQQFMWDRFKHFAAAAFSLDALKHSFLTVLRQGDRFAATRTEQGFNLGSRIFKPIIHYEGVRVLFAQKNREMLSRFTAEEWVLAEDDAGTRSPHFGALRAFLRQTQAQKIRVILFINPYHAEYLLAIDLAGLWPLFEAWKRRLVAVAAEEGGIAVWDFTGFNRFSTEAVDGAAARGEALSWFWEPAHYRRELGDLMLANMFRQYCPEGTQPEIYGTLIDVSNVDAQIRRLRDARKGYVTAHPEVLARLRRLAVAVR